MNPKKGRDLTARSSQFYYHSYPFNFHRRGESDLSFSKKRTFGNIDLSCSFFDALYMGVISTEVACELFQVIFVLKFLETLSSYCSATIIQMRDNKNV